MSCIRPECQWQAAYWYFERGKRRGMCFGHATVAKRETGSYGRIERKYRP